MRRRSDRLYVPRLGPREREALQMVEQRPGVTVAELADELGVSMTRAWQILGRLEGPRVRRCEAEVAAGTRPHPGEGG
jgi:hypothetical protein